MKMSNPDQKIELSIVVPCFNGETTIGELLEALAGQTWSKPWEVVIANNGSTDGTLDVIAKYQGRIPNLRVVDASDRRGAPHALNVGVQASIGENIASCDADDVVGEGYVEAIGEALQKHDFVACRLDMKRLNPEWLVADRQFPQDTGVQKYWYPPFLAHAGGGTIGLKRRLWQAMGGVDETLPYLYDTDLCFRLQLAGTQLEFVPKAVIHIRLRHGLKSICRQARCWGEDNVAIYKRYRPLGMPKLSPADGLRAWVRLLRQLRSYADMNFARRAQFMWEFWWRVGRLKGSLRQRVFAL